MPDPTSDQNIIQIVIGAIIAVLLSIPGFMFKSLTRRVRILEEHVASNGITRQQVEQMIDKAMHEVHRQHNEIMTAIHRTQDITRQDLMLCSKNLTDQISKLHDEVNTLYERRASERDK